MKITKRLLESKGACEEQVELFAQLFPKGVVLTKELCVEHAQRFDWDWAAEHLLEARAWEQYNKTRAPAWEQYIKIDVTAWEQYMKIEAPAWEQYKNITDPAYEQYKKQCAIAFYEASKGN